MLNLNSDSIFLGSILTVAQAVETPAEQQAASADNTSMFSASDLDHQIQQETQAHTVQPEAQGDGTFAWGGYMQAIGIMGLLLVGLWLLMKLIKNMGKNRMASSASSLSREEFYVEGHLPLGQNKGLFVVRFLNTRLVLGVTDQQISLLSEAEANTDEQNTSFQQVMESTRLQGSLDPPGQSADATGPIGPAKP